jgi:hypothetical protein
MEHLGVVWAKWVVSVKWAYDLASVCKRGETRTLATMRNYTVTELCFLLLPRESFSGDLTVATHTAELAVGSHRCDRAVYGAATDLAG